MSRPQTRWFLGHVKGAIATAQQAIDRSPQDPFYCVSHWVVGRAYFTLGNEYPNAIKSLKQSVSLMPKLWLSQAWLIAAYALNNEDGQAKTVRDEFIKKFPEWNLARMTEHYAKERFKSPTLVAATGGAD